MRLTQDIKIPVWLLLAVLLLALTGAGVMAVRQHEHLVQQVEHLDRTVQAQEELGSLYSMIEAADRVGPPVTLVTNVGVFTTRRGDGSLWLHGTCGPFPAQGVLVPIRPVPGHRLLPRLDKALQAAPGHRLRVLSARYQDPPVQRAFEMQIRRRDQAVQAANNPLFRSTIHCSDTTLAVELQPLLERALAHEYERQAPPVKPDAS